IVWLVARLVVVGSLGYVCLCLFDVSGCFLFFFSSRRRHTRSKRDWSSDVCSSDLDLMAGQLSPIIGQLIEQKLARSFIHSSLSRSEERRVGKECRSRWWPDHYKEKQQTRQRGEVTEEEAQMHGGIEYTMACGRERR